MSANENKLYIAGIPIQFPYKPYKAQFGIIDRAIHAIENKQNALLESPTGTGKTMAILCAVLGWQKKNKENENVKIYYTTRTHSQLSQLVSELRNTNYRVKSSCLASRVSYCIHENIRKEKGSIDQSCKILKNNNRCSHYNQVDANMEQILSSKSILDVEDLTQYGKTVGACPYYMAKKLGLKSDIIFAPYNYLLYPRIRKQAKLSVKDSIIIIDEAQFRYFALISAPK